MSAALARRRGGRLSVLFVSDQDYLPQRVGGTKSSTHDLCLSLTERGHRVAVLCHLGQRDLVGLYHRVARRLLPAHRPAADLVLGYPVFRAHHVTPQVVADAARLRQAQLIVVQAERPSPIIAAALATGRPVLTYLRDVELHKLDAPLPSGPRLRYVANSGFTASRYAEAFGITPDVLPPAIRAERFRCASVRRHYVTFINPVPLKGAEIAFALAGARPDLPFLFVAGWPVSPEEEAARQARVRALPNVTWQPSVQDMRTVYGRTRLLLAPSQWEEAWGRVASEAQVNGIPVLASRRGGLPEAVGPGGALVDHNAPLETWLAALSAMLDDPARYQALSQAAADHAARPEFQPEALVARFEAILVAHARAGAEAKDA